MFVIVILYGSVLSKQELIISCDVDRRRENAEMLVVLGVVLLESEYICEEHQAL